jgi:hypothetical protein
VLYDPEADLYLVSNINGKPTAKDGNGFISQVKPDGSVAALKWIDGATSGTTLNGPKGMALFEGFLYVADIDFIRVFDRKTGKPMGKIAVPQATFLNALSVTKDGTLYVSDSGLKMGEKGLVTNGSDSVHKIGTRREAEIVLKDTTLNGPNGIAAGEDGLWVVTYGNKELYQLADGKKGKVITLPTGGLDGLLQTKNGGVLVSSWEGSAVYYGKDGKFQTVMKDIKSPAAIGYDTKRDQLLVPSFLGNMVYIQKLNLPKAAPAPAKPPEKAAKNDAAKADATKKPGSKDKPVAKAPAASTKPGATPAAPSKAEEKAKPATPAQANAERPEVKAGAGKEVAPGAPAKAENPGKAPEKPATKAQAAPQKPAAKPAPAKPEVGKKPATAGEGTPPAPATPKQ